MKLILSKSGPILNALRRMVPGASQRTLRQMLATGRVQVNGKAVRIAALSLQAGDEVRIIPRAGAPPAVAGVRVIHEDRDILVVEKPAGLLTVATPHEKEKTLHARLRQQLQRLDRRNRLFVVHRLDKFVSGLLVFARTDDAREGLKSQFMRHSIVRKYWAVVEGKVAKSSDTIESYLAEDRSLRVHSTADASEGKRAVTHYRVLSRHHDATLLEVSLETGRKNQIRVHLSEMGHPITGDRAYGAKSNPLGRVGLHAFCLGFNHPRTGEPLLFQTDPPAEFRRLIPPGSPGCSLG